MKGMVTVGCLLLVAGLACADIAERGLWGKKRTRASHLPGLAEVVIAPPAEGAFLDVAALRQSIRTARPREGASVTVYLEEGEYPIRETLELEPADSNVRFIGKGRGAVFSGGTRIRGWRRVSDEIWEADIPVGADGKPVYFESLFVNGKRAVRARLPDTGIFHVAEAQRLFETNAVSKEVTERNLVLGEPGELPSGLRIESDDLPYAQIIVHHKWVSTRRPITGYDPKTGKIESVGRVMPPHNHWEPKCLFYLENVRAGFDAPGEWLYDAKAGKVLYRPRRGERMAKSFSFAFWQEEAVVTAPTAKLVNLLTLRGNPEKGEFVQNVTFRNVAFAHSDSPNRNEMGKPTNFPGGQAASGYSAAILADGARQVRFEGCEVRNTGEYAIWFRDGCMSNAVTHCLLTDLGAGGVRIGNASPRGGNPKGAVECRDYTPFSTAFNTVRNCIIRHGGRFHAAGIGVFIQAASDNVVTHNEISDLFYTGVSVGWTWGYGGSAAQRNEISYNRIHQIGQAALADMGGIYTLGTSFGTRLVGNVIYDVDSFSYGGWGLYPDEGSEGILLENNLVYDTKDASFHQHYGRNNILRNNILCCSRAGQVAVTRAEPHRSVTVERNIIYWTDGPTFQRYLGTMKETAKIDWVSNLWWKADGKFDFNGKTFAQWQEKGNDKDGLCADPLFVNPEKRDFRLRSDSPASKIGFQPFDFSTAGVEGDAVWKAKADE